ncbi:MAG: hypothetical protein KAJ63_03990, partial [Methyloprofundus sp.]|nr:hypothetical protein [Methyloprofundus sp.]
HDKKLDDPQFEKVRNIMLEGLEKGVFDIQLHGMAHYWPDNLMHALQVDDGVTSWLNEGGEVTESLPSLLQSRWIETKKLPTAPLQDNEVSAAVKEEVSVFKDVFGFSPKVVVPPTFVWTTVVENCWNEQALEYLITPGQCSNRRNEKGVPELNGQKIYNAQVSTAGLTYIVRNDFFEPGLEHTAEMALNALKQKTELAQPALLEIHRSNFIQSKQMTQSSLNELEKSIVLALENYPGLKFLTTKELADKYANNDLSLIELSSLIRLGVAMDRVWAYQMIRKWLYISGLVVPFLVFNKFIFQLAKI